MCIATLSLAVSGFATNPDSLQVINNNNLILINGTLLFSKKNIDKMIDLINTFFQKNTVLDIKTFKSLTKTSRKYAVPLLEYLDKIGITYRSENGRKYKK